MWIGIDDAEILNEDLLVEEEERVDLRRFGQGATARAKDKEDDAIISVFLNIYILRVL